MTESICAPVPGCACLTCAALLMSGRTAIVEGHVHQRCFDSELELVTRVFMMPRPPRGPRPSWAEPESPPSSLEEACRRLRDYAEIIYRLRGEITDLKMEMAELKKQRDAAHEGWALSNNLRQSLRDRLAALVQEMDQERRT